MITIAVVVIGQETEYYLMDGQHRMEMIKNLYDQTKENNKVIFAVHYIDTEENMRLLFDELNKDSSKSKPYVSLPIFGKKVVEQCKTKLTQKYEGAFSKKKSVASLLYTVDELVKILVENDYFENNSNADKILKNIEDKHKNYFSSLKYLENSSNDKFYAKKETDIINKYKNVIFFKNNNFINHLIDDEEPYHEYVTTRQSISESLREKVWKNEFKNSETGRCPVEFCTHELSKSKKFGFQCGHIVSVSNKGKTDEKNLKPICADCNTKMSSTNWDYYENELIASTMWEDKFGDDSEGECENCPKKVSIDNFYLKDVKLKNGKTKKKIVYKKCVK